MNTELTFKPLKLKDQPEKVCPVYIPAKTAEKKKIPTLYITNLPFSAALAANAGVPVIGYNGICDQNSADLSTLHPDFTFLLQKKQVHTVALIYNADILDPQFRPGCEHDLASPLFNIYYAVKKLRDLLISFDRDITLMYANIKHQFRFEGIISLDDLVRKYGDAVFKSMENLGALSNTHFDSINLTELSLNRLYTHLRLKDAISFYSYHADILKQNEFIFKSVSYCHDGDKLEKIQYTDAKLYLRVGPDYYKRIMIRNAHEEFEEVLTNWKIGEIGRDYGVEFIKQIPRFDAFINKPDNNGEYQRIITSKHNGIVSNLFNIYHPVDWEPKAGEWPHIEKFIRHIFSACNVDGEILYEFGLDYLQLTYQKPKQRLPILALVSAERNTGKSTFLDFLKLLYGANMAILDNQRFNPKFTSHFAGKLIVAIDEGHIPLQDKTTKEMIKNMATGKVMWLEGKGANAKSVDNFTHLLFCSNNERNFMQIDPGENRFAVLKVPSYRKQGSKDDPDLLEKMRLEIPAFLNFLQNRKLKYSKRITRFWFDDLVYVTEALQVVMDRTKSTIEKELENWLCDAFFNTQRIELNYTLSDITEELNRYAEYKFPKSKVADLLSEKYNITPGPSLRYVLYTSDKSGETVEEKKKGRYCTFFAKDWLTEDQFTSLFKNDKN